MMNIKTVLMLSVSCLTFMAAKDASANLNYNINSRESNLDTKHIYTHKHLDTKHLSSAYFSSPMAFNLRGLSIAPSGSNLSTSGFPQTASVCFMPDLDDPEKRKFCKGMRFESPDDNPEYDPDPDSSCKKEGYLKTSCEPLYDPYNYCPYDRKYWEKCVCKTEIKKTCEPPFWGIGSACDGKYERCCKNDCPAGYAPDNGFCRQSSSLKTECGNACYKILSNTCGLGSLTPPAETDGNRNKVVFTTDCGNVCWQSVSDNCPSGYVKTKVNGKCYETTVTYTPFGSSCYKEKPCCDDTCEGYRTIPTWRECQSAGYKTSTTGCGNKCYTCKKPCNDTCEGYRSIPTTELCRYGYNSTVTECGSECYICKNKTQCDDSCSGYKTIPTSAQCPGGYDTSKNLCGNNCYTCKSPCSEPTPHYINGICSECRTDDDCINNINSGYNYIYPNEKRTYAEFHLPFRYYSRCNLSLGKCVEALSVADCKNRVDPKVKKAEYNYGDSRTTHVQDNGNCGCFTYYDSNYLGGEGMSVNTDHHGISCAVKDCRTDSDCKGFTMDGRITYCRHHAGYGNFDNYCVPNADTIL